MAYPRAEQRLEKDFEKKQKERYARQLDSMQSVVPPLTRALKGGVLARPSVAPTQATQPEMPQPEVPKARITSDSDAFVGPTLPSGSTSDKGLTGPVINNFPTPDRPIRGSSVKRRGMFDDATMAEVADYRQSLGPDATTEFNKDNIADYTKPGSLSGSYAGTLPSGATFSTMPGWSEADQAQLDQLRSEGYGSGRIAEQKERARIASLRPTKTSKRERQKMIRDARLRGTKMTHSRRGWGEDTSAADSEIAQLQKQFAAEDKAYDDFNVAQLEQEDSTKPSFSDQVAAMNLGLNLRKANLNEEMKRSSEARAQTEAERERQKEIMDISSSAGLPLELHSMISKASNPHLAGSKASQYLSANPELIKTLNSTDPDLEPERQKILAKIRALLVED